MVDIIDDNFMVCGDCYPIITNGDASSLDYYYSHEIANERFKAIHEALDLITGNVVAGDYEKDEEFTKSSCDLCNSPLAGSRYHCVVLSR